MKMVQAAAILAAVMAIWGSTFAVVRTLASARNRKV